jgi:hypothetical protein
MIEKGIDGALDKKHTCYPLGKQITLQTINRLKQKLGYRNSHTVYYKTRISDPPVEATLTEIDLDIDVERMKKDSRGGDGDQISCLQRANTYKPYHGHNTFEIQKVFTHKLMMMMMKK